MGAIEQEILNKIEQAVQQHGSFLPPSWRIKDLISEVRLCDQGLPRKMTDKEVSDLKEMIGNGSTLGWRQFFNTEYLFKRIEQTAFNEQLDDILSQKRK